MMLQAGLRIGEVASLTVGDIHVSDRKGSVEIRQGKGSKYRLVPLNSDIRKAVLKYLDVRPNVGEALFASQKGGGLTSNAIWKVVKKYGEAAGIPEVTPHALRHTFGTSLIRKHGVDLVTYSSTHGSR